MHLLARIVSRKSVHNRNNGEAQGSRGIGDGA